MRRGLIVGVTSFTPAEGDGEPDLDGLPGLPFAEELAVQVRDGLGAFGYESDLVVGGATLTAQVLGSTVRDFLQSAGRDDLAIIHIISHGQIVGRGDLHAIGSDGLWHETTDVEQWLKSVDKTDKGPIALFVLDLCYSGVAARLPWQLEAADGSARSWVLAASERERQAYDGQFSRAFARVLTDLAAGRLEIDEAVEFVPLQTIGRAVRREVARLASGGYRQNVTASVLDMAADPDHRFFPNRAFRPRAGIRTPRASLDVALTPFADQLDEVIDAWHFVSRAAGSGPVQEQPTVGFFRGRRNELAVLSRWIDGEGESGTRLVTGSPGAGKSALLGVLVCAAHPLLRDATEHLWRGPDESPGANATLAAVHARNRRLDDVVGSLRRQLHLPAAVSESASDLIDGIKSLAAPPVVIIDALDEADNPNALLTILLLPLIHSQRADGSPICRLIVGSRTGSEWSQLEPLRRALPGDGEIIDLDEVPAERLETDLCRYLDDLLRTRSPYKDASFGPGRRRIAAAAGRALAYQDRAEKRWGEFLVAGLCTSYFEPRPTRHIRTRGRGPSTTHPPDIARGLGDGSPSSSGGQSLGTTGAHRARSRRWRWTTCLIGRRSRNCFDRSRAREPAHAGRGHGRPRVSALLCAEIGGGGRRNSVPSVPSRACRPPPRFGARCKFGPSADIQPTAR